MTSLEASNIHKTYRLGHTEIRVLRGASLAVTEGESVAIVGRSGAGKSTLLHVLGGLDQPEAGRISVQGESLYDMSAGRRTRLRAEKVGFVFQSYHLLPEMDILENVMLPAMASSRALGSAAAVRSRALELLTAVGLSDRRAHTPMELSGGEQQRVALARAMMNDPAVLLADEPTGNLDRKTGSQVLEALFSLARGKARTLVVVTHDEGIAASCDRTLRLESGLLV